MHVCACVYTNPVILLFFCDSHIASPLHPSLYFHLEFPLKIKLHQKRWTKVLPLLSVHITNKTLIFCEPSGQPIQLWSVGKMWPSFFCYFISSVLRERSRKTGAIIHMQFHIISWLIFYARYAHVAASLSIFSKRARWHSENIGKLLLICFGILQKTEVETSGGTQAVSRRLLTCPCRISSVVDLLQASDGVCRILMISKCSAGFLAKPFTAVD